MNHQARSIFHVLIGTGWLAIMLSVCLTINPRTAPKGLSVALLAMTALFGAHAIAGSRAADGID